MPKKCYIIKYFTPFDCRNIKLGKKRGWTENFEQNQVLKGGMLRRNPMVIGLNVYLA